MKSQFYLVENPKLNMEDEQFIYHSKKPRFFAKIIAFQDDIDIAVQEHFGENITFFYINPDSIREVHTLVITEVIDEAEINQLQGKLKRMADWYVDYLMWEDRQEYGKGGIKQYLTDWNELTPGQKILFNKTLSRWAIIYNGIVKVFNNEPEMDEYLTTKLNFSDEQLEEGYLNTL